MNLIKFKNIAFAIASAFLIINCAGSPDDGGEQAHSATDSAVGGAGAQSASAFDPVAPDLGGFPQDGELSEAERRLSDILNQEVSDLNGASFLQLEANESGELVQAKVLNKSGGVIAIIVNENALAEIADFVRGGGAIGTAGVGNELGRFSGRQGLPSGSSGIDISSLGYSQR